ncbi:hypothetical protein BLNAU_3788 [Blattamonas nauphoetae]|uniref:Uncharacterized protein n=1 Tax=Blattamonas nauphoetae TaxID=2049346 RepID=A0ABQ9YC70_9EUKA|nr:hypothetical protein BLNAU_3788 [Blattamonas nauphoetae]
MASWVVSDFRCRQLWLNVLPHWTTLIVDFEPIPMRRKSYLEGITTRQQCLHWLLRNFDEAAITLLNQGFARKLLVHMNQTESNIYLLFDVKMLVSRRLSRNDLVPQQPTHRGLHSTSPDSPSDSFQIDPLDGIQQRISAGVEDLIDVEEAEEKRAIGGQGKEENLSELEDDKEQDGLNR